MEVKCDICWEKVNIEVIKKVQSISIESNSCLIPFKNVLQILFPIPVKLHFICPKCYDTSISFFILREKACDNYKQNLPESQMTLVKINNYLSNIDEPTTVIIERDILKIVPDSLKQQHKAESTCLATLLPRIFVEVNEDEFINFEMEVDAGLPYSTPKRKAESSPPTAKRMKQMIDESDSDLSEDGPNSRVLNAEQLKCLNQMIRLSQLESSKFICPVCKTVKTSISAMSSHIRNNHVKQFKARTLEASEKPRKSNEKENVEDISDISSEGSIHLSCNERHESDNEIMPEEQEQTIESSVIPTTSSAELKPSTDGMLAETQQNDESIESSSGSSESKKYYRYNCRDPALNRAQQEMLSYLMRESFVDNDNFKCIMCDHRTRSERLAVNHIKFDHLWSQTSNVQKWISRETAKGKYETDKQGEKSYEWRCGMCAKVYVTQGGLYNHFKFKHATILAKNN